MNDRVKTDIRLTSEIMDEIDIVVKRLGISKNAFYALSISLGVALAKVFIMGDCRGSYQLFFDTFTKLRNSGL